MFCSQGDSFGLGILDSDERNMDNCPERVEGPGMSEVRVGKLKLVES
jgi:hypothetical protein